MGSFENSGRIEEEPLHSDMELGTASQVSCNSRAENVGSLVDGNAVDCVVSRGDCDIPSVGCAGSVNTCEDTDGFCAQRDGSLGEERNNECDDGMTGFCSEIAPRNLSDGDGMTLKGVSENVFVVASAEDRECLPAESVKTEEVSDSSGDRAATHLTKPSVDLPEPAGGVMRGDNVHDTKKKDSSCHLVERSVDAVSTADNGSSRVDMATCDWESFSLTKTFLGSIAEIDALNFDFQGEMDSNRIEGLKDGIVLNAIQEKVNADVKPTEVISHNGQKCPATEFLYTDVQGLKQIGGACVKVPSVQTELHFVEEIVDGHVGNLGDGCNPILDPASGKVASKENLTEGQRIGCSLKILKKAMSEEVHNSLQNVDTYDSVLSSEACGVSQENEVNISCSSDNIKDLCVNASITDGSLLLPSKDHDGTLEPSCPVDSDIESAKNNKETSTVCVEKRVSSHGNGINEPAPINHAGCEISALGGSGHLPSDDSSSSDLFSNAQNEQENDGLFCNVIMQECMEAAHMEGNVVRLSAGTTAPGCPAEALESVQANQPSPAFENCCSNMQDLSSLESTIETGFISTVENEECNDEEKCTAAPNCLSEDKVPVTVFLSPRRSSQVNKSGRKTQAKRAARNSRNVSKVASSSGNEDFILKAAKRKRSSCFKKAKSSEWGRLQNIFKLFVQKNELDLEQISGQGSQKARGGRRNKKQQRKQVTGSRQVSKGKQHVSSRCVRLKVKLGKSDLVIVGPEVASTTSLPNAMASETSSQERSCSKIPICAADTEHNLREYGIPTAIESLDNNPEKKFDQNDAQETATFRKKTCGDAEKGYLDASFAEIGGVTDIRYLDPETSPDSEVINTTPEAQAVETHADGIQSAVLHSAEDLNPCKKITKSKREKKTNRVSHGSNQRNGSSNSSVTKSKQVKKNGCRMKPSESFHLGESFASSNTSNSLSNNKELVALSSEMEVGFSNVSFSDAGNEAPNCQDKNSCLSELENTKSVLSSAKRKGKKLPKGSKSSRSGTKSKVSYSTKSKGGNARRPKEKQQRSINKTKVKDNDISHQFPCKVENLAEADGGQMDDGCKKINKSANPAGVDILKSELMPGNTVEQQLPTHNAWVRCDDCHKWRRIPAALADSIEDTNSNWNCADNMDKKFADCSIPQEKSNADINAELEISDASGEDDDYYGRRNYKELELRRPPVCQQSSFIQIDSNKFLHRSRRTQTIDEVMVCHCKPRSDGRLGCGDECLNRMLNIECVQGTCPCGDLCSNQQFQKRNYANMQWFRCGKKGYGLQLLQDMPKGGFIIEYVGEVLDMPTYEERQREYASKGHKHFYFMTLNGSEVIDASAKGNLGRFINHSCEPNCRTEKWMVNGEICIGLFALRDLKKGEEVTFDYNYVRVFGAAAKKCVCGSPLCRGYIGGDPLNTEVIVQVDSDDEYPEPVMLLEDGNLVNTVHDLVPETNSFTEVETSVVKDEENGGEVDVSTKSSADQLPITKCGSDSVDESSGAISTADRSLSINHPAENSPPSASLVDITRERNEATAMPVFVDQEESAEKDPLDVNLNGPEKSETSLKKLHNNSLSQDASRKSKPDTVDEKSSQKLHTGRTISKLPSSVKRGKGVNSSLSANKSMGMASKAQQFPFKPKKTVEGRFEAVQEKLNELLDADGGISKRKDAPRGYLKLLLLTAASGDNGHGEAIQSNRDLSMILDALLKTRSRVVLTDIINKNGLRMLHNIMKQYRKDFKKIPILRKLLKVLEYLAMREILTVDHINVGPPCPGMESFRESILSLTEHDDKQVHQIARNFRDRWLPRNIRKLCYADRDDGFRGLSQSGPCGSNSSRYDRSVRPTEAIDCVRQSIIATSSVTNAQDSGVVSTESSLTNGTRIRKRKSRWDQPAEPNLDSVSLQHKEKRASPAQSGCPETVHILCSLDKGGEQNSNEDIPPGFSPSFETSRVSSNASTKAMDISQENMHVPTDAVSSHPQERFISRMPVSYGVPLSILKQFGTPGAENGECWAIAPGMPFHPFPPLPSYPRDHKRRLSECTVDSWTCNSVEERQPDKCSTSSKCTDETGPSTMVANHAETEVPCASNQQMFKRMRGSSQDLGKRYFRQQKWNSTNKFPPWVRNRNCW